MTARCGAASPKWAGWAPRCPRSTAARASDTRACACWPRRSAERPVDHPAIPEEEIEVVPVALADLDALITEVHDAKSLIGLLRLRRVRAS